MVADAHALNQAVPDQGVEFEPHLPPCIGQRRKTGALSDLERFAARVTATAIATE